jgi:hypothetical protein
MAAGIDRSPLPMATTEPFEPELGETCMGVCIDALGRRSDADRSRMRQRFAEVINLAALGKQRIVLMLLGS